MAQTTKTKVVWKRGSKPAVIHGNYSVNNGVVTGHYDPQELLLCNILSDGVFTEEAKRKMRERYIKGEEDAKKK